ncbi:hypothetical protein GGF32_006592 [Allomyces javanicus]|nr:hypothetical protein GGF32_006592 [Allomyces javanicus]
MAPKLEKLHLMAPCIHLQFLTYYLSQDCTTLRKLALHAVIEVTAEVMTHIAADTAIGCPELRDLDVPITALFLMVAGAATDSSLPHIASLNLCSGKLIGTAAPGPLPALPELAELSLVGFLLLHIEFLFNVAAKAPCLSKLQLIECQIDAGSKRVKMPALKACLLDRTVVSRNLMTFIDAPALDRQHMCNDVVFHLNADAFDTLAYLMNLALIGDVQWINNQMPLLENVTHLVALASVVKALAQEPHSLPSLIDLKVVSPSDGYDENDDVLQLLPLRPLGRISAKAAHPRVFAA